MTDLKKMKKMLFVLAAILTVDAGSVAATPVAHAEKGDQGVDWSVWNGAYGQFGYGSDKFTINQIGGYQGGLYDQWTYGSQVSSAIAQGKRAHTYIWYEVGGNLAAAETTMNYFLPKVQTPKGSIVALDYEGGASWDNEANTQAILYGMRRIRDAGYTPMYYSYKPYTLAHVNYQEIISEFPDSLWIAAYPSYDLTPSPLYGYFPSMDGIAIWQFTSTYNGSIDGNVDLTGITDNGYTRNNEPSAPTDATEQGATADNTPKKDIKPGFKVKVNFSSSTWSTGESIPDWVKGNTYDAKEVDGSKVLLSDVFSWINENDVEVIQSKDIPAPAQNTVHTVADGETLTSIATQYGTNYQQIVAWNGLSDPDFIYPGQQLIVGQQSNDNQLITERGTYSPFDVTNIRTAPNTSSAESVGQYKPGELVNYDGYVLSEGFVWIHYVSYTGLDRYIAVRSQGGNAWGTFN